MRTSIGSIVLLSLFMLTCNTSNDGVDLSKREPLKDLAAILERGTLRVLTENGAVSFYEYKDKFLGFEYDILDTFARSIGVDLEVVMISNPKDFVKKLNTFEGDIIACNKPITMSDKELHAFSLPYNHSFQVLIQRNNPDSLIRDISELQNKTLYIRNKSAFVKRILHLEDEIGANIEVRTFPNYPIAEDLIEKVSNGEIDYTIAMENTARIEQSCVTNIDISTLLSVRQNIAFGLRKSDELLKEKLDYFLDDFLYSKAYKVLRNKYFDYMEETDFFIRQKDTITNEDIRLSDYDEMFKASALKRNWDWRFLASIAYQESRYNPKCKRFWRRIWHDAVYAEYGS